MTNTRSDVRSTEVWIGLAHVRPAADPDILDGAIGAYAPIVAKAKSAEEFVRMSMRLMNDMGLEVIEVEDVELLRHRLRHGRLAPELAALADGLTRQDPVAVGTFDAYEGE